MRWNAEDEGGYWEKSVIKLLKAVKQSRIYVICEIKDKITEKVAEVVEQVEVREEKLWKK